MAISIVQGENFIHRFNLKKPDGTSLVLSTDLSACTVEVMQKTTVLATYTYPDANLRLGDTTSQLELEVPAAITDLFNTGDVKARLTITSVDAEFEVDAGQIEVVEKTIATVRA